MIKPLILFQNIIDVIKSIYTKENLFTAVTTLKPLILLDFMTF